MQLVVVLAPLALGVTGWGLSTAGILNKRKVVLCGLSWFVCACALWFPLYTICHWAQIGDVSAILDCVRVYTVCAGVLLAVNGILNVLVVFINRKK